MQNARNGWMPSRGAVIGLMLIVISALMRLGWLGHLPLNDREAAAALHAALGTTSASSFFSALPGGSGLAGYEGLTAILFHLFGASTALARLVPALAGWALTFWPLAMRRHLGWLRALILSGLLVLSPTLVATSRSVAGHSMALFGAALALSALADGGKGARQGRLFACGLGLLAVAGPAAILGLASLAWAALAYGMWTGFMANGEGRRLTVQFPGRGWWLGGGLIALLLGTGFGLEIGHLAGIAGGLEGWMRGWSEGGGQPAGFLLVNLVAFDGLIFLFGLAGALSALRRRDGAAVFMAGWGLSALVLGLIYPARHPLDMAWVLLPFSVLASDWLGRWLAGEHDRQSWGWQVSLVLAILVIVVFMYMQLAGAPLAVEGAGVPRWALALSAFALSGAALILFGLGWSWHGARDVVVIAAGIVLGLVSLSGIWRSQFAQQAVEGPGLLRPQAASPSLDLLVQTAERVSLAQAGTAHGLDLYFADRPPPALAWALRAWEPWEGGQAEGGESSAPLLLARADLETAPFDENYLGQTFAVTAQWVSSGERPSYFEAWLRGRLPAALDIWVLLAREADLVIEGDPLGAGP